MITDLKRAYENSEISKKDYAEKMFSGYLELFSYQGLMECSNVKKILIEEDKIIFYIKMNNKLEKNNYIIKMIISKEDRGAIPITILTFGEYENQELNMINKLIRYIPKGIIFDVGANLGWYTLNIKKQFPESNIFAFEPIPQIFEKMLKNLEINGLKDINCFNEGLYRENKFLKFYYNCIESGASSMRDLRENEFTEEINCKVSKLDDFMIQNNILNIDFIKCDVEGSELFVYQGGLETIKKYKPIIFSEMLRKWSAKFGYHPNDIIDLFNEIGYRCFVISENEMLKKFDRVDENTTETNYFFLHKEKHEQIIKELVEN